MHVCLSPSLLILSPNAFQHCFVHFLKGYSNCILNIVLYQSKNAILNECEMFPVLLHIHTLNSNAL